MPGGTQSRRSLRTELTAPGALDPAIPCAHDEVGSVLRVLTWRGDGGTLRAAILERDPSTSAKGRISPGYAEPHANRIARWLRAGLDSEIGSNLTA